MILTDVTHATLFPLCFTIRYTLSTTTLTTFQARCTIGHRRTGGTIGWFAGTSRFLLTSRILSVSTFHIGWHELTVLTTWRVLIAIERNTSNGNFSRILAIKKHIYLHTAPWPRLNLQNLLQQLSLSSVPNKPASHSSFFSTRKLPQNDSWGSEKHRPDFAWSTLRIERRLQGENFCGK